MSLNEPHLVELLDVHLFVRFYLCAYCTYSVNLLHLFFCMLLHQALIQKGLTSQLKTQTMSSLPPPQWQPYCIVA